MQFGILITNDGTHSAEKWAAAAADKIVTIAQKIDGEKLLAAQKLQLAITEALIKHHADAQEEIKTSLATGTHFDSPIVHTPGERLDTAIQEIIEAAKGTPWEEHFLNEKTLAEIKYHVGQSLVDMAHVERSHYADKNPNDIKAQAYKAQPTGILNIPASEIVGV